MNKKMIIPALLCAICVSCGQGVGYKLKDYRTVMKFHDNFKVMQLTDLHLGLQGDLAKNLGFIGYNIDHADPDLIVITGDSMMYGTKGIVDNYIKYLNDKCQELSNKHPERITKFAITFGNHDNQGDYPRYYINNVVKKYVTEDGNELKDNKYAAFLDYENDNLSGLTNYFIDLVDDTTKSKDEVDVKYRLHILDSNTYHYIGPKYRYEVIQEDQLAHLANIYQNATKDKDYVGMAFFHIPFIQFEELKDKYKADENRNSYGQGEFREGVGDPYYDNGSFRKMRDANIVSYFVGHDHINYSDIIYNHEDSDINNKAIFSYGVKSTDQIYHNDDMLGYKLINLRDNMTVEKFITIENINENFINVIDRGDYYDK